MNHAIPSTLRKVLFGALATLCIFGSVVPSNDAEACPPRRPAHHLPAPHPPRVHVAWRIPVAWTLPSSVPSLPVPQPVPAADGWPADWSRFEEQALALTNQRRAQGAVCGDKAYAPAPPLVMSAALRQAAREHSSDMGARSYFDHGSPDGRSPADRMRAAGWSSGFTGENIFGGPRTAEEVVDGWMKSPGHCANIMSPNYKAIGIGYARRDGSPLGHYWTQDFGG
jgi:uncharacterized protein YkwD